MKSNVFFNLLLANVYVCKRVVYGNLILIKFAGVIKKHKYFLRRIKCSSIGGWCPFLRVLFLQCIFLPIKFLSLKVHWL